MSELTATQPPEADIGVRRIGVWGATQSGKSTFLSALYIAAARSPRDLRIYGTNNDSTEFLVRNTHLLNAQRLFPLGTVLDSRLSWDLAMTTPAPARGLLGRRKTATVSQVFRLELNDPPGLAFAAVPPDPATPARRNRLDIGGSSSVEDYLARCDGIVLLIDPLRERDLGDAHEYFHGTLLRLAQRNLAGASGRRLEQHIAVCVTKYDEQFVYEFARDNGYQMHSDTDPYMFPLVHSDNSKQFLLELCKGSERSDVTLVTNALDHFFDPSRVRFFVTSSIGFYVNESGQFDEDDYTNVVPRTGDISLGKYGIRGQIIPINVVEPLEWLGRSVAAGRAAP